MCRLQTCSACWARSSASICSGCSRGTPRRRPRAIDIAGSTRVRAGHLHTHAAAYREAPSGIGHVRTIDICTMHRPRLASSPPPAWTPSPTRSTGCRRAPRNSASRSDAGCRGVREVAAREAPPVRPARHHPPPTRSTDRDGAVDHTRGSAHDRSMYASLAPGMQRAPSVPCASGRWRRCSRDHD